MTIEGILQTSMDTSLIHQKRSELNQETQPKMNTEKDAPSGATDTASFTAGVSERPTMEFASLDEEQASILAQLVANNLTNQPFGISTPAGTDILRTFM